MKRYSLIGLYPMTEDLQPGDVLLDVPPVAGADPQPQVQRLGSLDKRRLKASLMQQDRDRLEFASLKADPAVDSAPDKPAGAATVTTNASAPAGATIHTITTVQPAAASPKAGAAASPQPVAKVRPKPGAVAAAPVGPEVADADAIPADGQARFRRVALPGITAARVYDWQVGAVGPIGRAAVALGLAGNGSAAMYVHLDGLQMLGLDSLAVLDLLQRNVASWLDGHHLTAVKLLTLVEQANPDAARRICRGDAAPPSNERSLIRVVNRVMYAHGIQYEYSRSSEFAGRLAFDLVQGAGVPGSGSAPAATAVGAVPASGGEAAAAELARLQAVNAALASSTPATAGARASLGIGTFGNAALKQDYLKPMAVGYVVARSYPVRDSLVLVNSSPVTPDLPETPTPDQQLLSAQRNCDRFLADELAKVPDGTRWATQLSPVETIICGNMTEAVLRTGASSARCYAAPYPVAPHNKQAPFDTHQLRDGQLHSLVY